MDRMITTREAAERLGVDISTVRRYFDAGKLDGWASGEGERRTIRISLASVQTRLKSGVERE